MKKKKYLQNYKITLKGSEIFSNWFSNTLFSFHKNKQFWFLIMTGICFKNAGNSHEFQEIFDNEKNTLNEVYF